MQLSQPTRRNLWIYLWPFQDGDTTGQPFVIKTDQQSFKYRAKIEAAIAAQGIGYIGLDYSIQYKRGRHNVMADEERQSH